MQIVTKTRDEAKQVLKKLTSGEDMGELAKEYSIAPEAETGGRLGWIRQGDLEERMDKIIFSLPLGKISTIVQTSYGCHIFKVLSERPEGYNTLPESIEIIESKLLLEKKDSFYREWLKELRTLFPVVVSEQIKNNWSPN